MGKCTGRFDCLKTSTRMRQATTPKEAYRACRVIPGTSGA